MMVEKTLPEIHISEDLARFLKKESNRQFIIRNLINIKKNLTGVTTDITVYLYEKLNLRRDSIKRMKSSAWHHKAQGIYELYMMNQREEQAAIFGHTNSNNEYVRMEAQTASIGFSGFNGLVFLDNLTYPLHEWQQIKLLEQLAAIDIDNMPHLPHWLQSSNEYVIQFALKLADIYQQIYVNDIVITCLSSNNEKIRYQAIKTLGRIAQETTADALKERYYKETSSNKLEIIKQLAIIGTSDDLPFLTDRLKEEDESLILEAGRAIMTASGKNWQIMEEKKISESIFKQIKYEFAQ
ncbi:MAG TPA: HEAT repeat domain-containing protein [Chitinophagaceae bacterium]|nr:HEAT repeat domain-containing protein [Chitinophagaceae bacterium]